MKVYLVTDGDLYDYDAPAPKAIFLTEQEAWKFVSDSVYVREYSNGDVVGFVEYSYIYEFPLGEEAVKEDVREILIGGQWCEISKEHKDWKP